MYLANEPDPGPMILVCENCNRKDDHFFCWRWLDVSVRFLFPKWYARNV